ncbi:MAG: hypothetical protein KKD17_02300, partial [Nanoarchaeota archaeon]|nr:hypothetical protein [Nanoarchaeota archaeon]
DGERAPATPTAPETPAESSLPDLTDEVRTETEASPLESRVKTLASAAAAAGAEEVGESLFEGEDDVYTQDTQEVPKGVRIGPAEVARPGEEVTRVYRPGEKPDISAAVPAPSTKAALPADVAPASQPPERVSRLIEEAISSHSTALDQRLQREAAEAAQRVQQSAGYTPSGTTPKAEKPETEEKKADNEKPKGLYASWKERRAERKRHEEAEKAKKELAKQKESPEGAGAGLRKKGWIYGGAAAALLAIGIGTAAYFMSNRSGEDTSGNSGRAAVSAVADAGTSSADAGLDNMVLAMHGSRDAGVGESGYVGIPVGEQDSGIGSSAGSPDEQPGDAVGDGNVTAPSAGDDAARSDCNLNLKMDFDSTRYAADNALDSLKDYLATQYANGVRHITIFAHRSMEDRADLARAGHPVLDNGEYNTGLAARSGAKASRDAQRIADAAGLAGLEFEVVNLSETDVYDPGTAEEDFAKNRGVTFSPNSQNPETDSEAAEDLAGCEDSVPCGDGCAAADSAGSGRTGSLDSHGRGAGQTADGSDVLVSGDDDIPVYADLSGFDSPEAAVQVDSQDDTPIYVEVMLSDRYGIPIFGELTLEEVLSKNSSYSLTKNGISARAADPYDNDSARECLKIAATINREYRHTLFGQQYGNALSKGNFSAEFEAKHGFACPDGVASEVYTLMAACMGDELVSSLRQLFAENGLIESPEEEVIVLGEGDYELLEDAVNAQPAQRSEDVAEQEPIVLDYGDFETLDEDGKWVMTLGENDYEPIDDAPQVYAQRDTPPPLPDNSYRPDSDTGVMELSEADIVEVLDDYAAGPARKSSPPPLPQTRATSKDVQDALAELVAMEEQRIASDRKADSRAEIDRMFDELMAYEAERQEHRYAA